MVMLIVLALRILVFTSSTTSLAAVIIPSLMVTPNCFNPLTRLVKKSRGLVEEAMSILSSTVPLEEARFIPN